MIAEMDTSDREKHEFVPQAILKRSPGFFADQGIKFRDDLDDLNTFQIAELSLDDLPFALIRHDGTPVDETEIYLPNSIPLDRLPEIITRLLAVLGLSSAAVTWLRDRSDTPF